MKKQFLILLQFVLPLIANAQEWRQPAINIALFNAGNAMPFSNFNDLVAGPYHPGFELAKTFNWSTKKRHDWFQEIEVAYFYHRFVQHAVPLNTAFGYRYKLGAAFYLQGAAGAGYLHSIPATGVYKLNSKGEYVNSKGIGRPQANATVDIGVGYVAKKDGATPMRIFISYKERLQFPFINAYVPLLPYNNLLLGVSVPVPHHQKNKSHE